MTSPMTDLPRGTDAWSREATDAWSREARRVRNWATVLGLALDEEDLTLCDVHGLQALHASLRARWITHEETGWALRQGPHAAVQTSDSAKPPEHRA